MQTIGDVAGLAQWTLEMANAVEAGTNLLFLENVPKRVVDAFKSDRVASGGVTLEGEHGELTLELRQQLENIHSGWRSATSGLRQLGNSLDQAAVAAILADLNYDSALLDVASAEAALDRDLAMSTLNQMAATYRGLTGIASGGLGGAVGGATGGPAGAALGAGVGMFNAALSAAAEAEIANDAAAISRQAADRQRNLLRNKQDLEEDRLAATQQDIFLKLAERAETLHLQIEDALSMMRNSTAEALRILTQLQSNENEARLEAAKATGADFVRLAGSNAPLPIPVNTVQRRQYDITRHRYDEALHRAKRLAYMARLSIEQRIGVRLDALKEPIGPLPAPSLWADDVCSLQGIDYSALRTASPNGDDEPGDEEARIGEFADQYVGDYVRKLKEFVDFYNIEFPFHEADDRAVISLKEHLLPRGTCSGESRNLLYFSAALGRGSDHSSPPSAGGWEIHGCAENDGTCLVVTALTQLPNTTAIGVGQPSSEPAAWPVGPGGVGGVSWLRRVSPTNFPKGPPSSLTSPPGSVYQAVQLEGQAQYVLSWWDKALTDTGTPAATANGVYSAAVYNSSWELIAHQVLTPQPSTDNRWGERRATAFIVPLDGTYYVAFEVSLDSGATSFGIANVQLERTVQTPSLASAYEQTDESRTVFKAECDAGAAVQKAFSYRCEKGTCFYEMNAPFAISVREIEARNSNLSGLVGTGNYNHRQVDLAVNLVGSGVLDCGQNPTPACYANGFVEYQITHDAYDIPIPDYGNEPRCFTFGTGAVRGGKALAAERYITFPLSSADKGLLEQPGILRPELFGRPLSGNYKLRIVDNPALDWEQVDDIQLVIGYRVWSRVTRTPGN